MLVGLGQDKVHFEAELDLDERRDVRGSVLVFVNKKSGTQPVSEKMID